jgi:hypothetical protein
MKGLSSASKAQNTCGSRKLPIHSLARRLFSRHRTLPKGTSEGCFFYGVCDYDKNARFASLQWLYVPQALAYPIGLSHKFELSRLECTSQSSCFETSVYIYRFTS